MRTKVILVFALIMGLITTYLFFNYMEKIEEENKKEVRTTKIVVAATDIMKNQIITKKMLTYKEIAKNSVPPQVIIDSESIIGKFADTDIVKSEPILEHRVISKKKEDKYISRKFNQGCRAVSVGVNIVQSVTNLIEPEDYVDVIFSEEIEKEDGTKYTQTELILQNVRVLAVGRRMVEVQNKEDYVEYTSVTLELNQQDTVELVNAYERGNIHFTAYSRINN